MTRSLLRGLGALLLVAIALNPRSARPDTVETLVMPGKVIEGHADIEGQCRKCHQPFKKEGQNALCLDCHKAVAQDVASKSGYHGRISEKPCRECHAEHLGRPAKIVKLDEGRFDHRQTDFLLLGKHTAVKCVSCHPSARKFREAEHECVSCHRKDDVHHGTVGAGCERCHTETDWKKAKFDHDKTHFPLRGRHAQPKCTACHRTQNFRETPNECVGCHRRDDVHKGKLGANCAECHNDRGWKKTAFDHEKTHFPLSGKHGAVKCADCHRDQSFKETPRECVACHRKDDIHKGSLGADCDRCHNDRDWKNTAFDHGKTKFPLLGAHGTTRCLACHRSQAFQDGPPSQCVACHRKNDVHKGRFGERCETCHGETAWKTLKFDHDRDTNFRLRESHSRVKCDSCHSGMLYADKAPKDCNGCHAKSDVHRGSLGTQCESCHNESKWKTSSFAHDRDTRYPLRGRHASITCKACHLDGTFRQKLAMQCIACHRKDDRHAGQEGSECERCHAETSWKTTNFDHGRANFPLTGRHLSVKCEACHASPKFKDARRECLACHARQDVHKRRLGADCASCHNARDWRIWDFDHDKRTHFVLDGAHRKLDCVTCHVHPGDTIPAVGVRCVDCHERDDVHREAFGNRCERCHATSSFKEIRH
ncbi:MAG: cytochrome C [Betaproteobacteria bacterium]|nr:cytochrome C [Betaproteobacteria bacterium]